LEEKNVNIIIKTYDIIWEIWQNLIIIQI
jgi:hypothetical protein